MKIISDFEMGTGTFDPKTEIIKFEGDNDQLFWRVAGEIINPKAQIVIPETHSAIYIKDGVMQNILEGGRHQVFELKKGLFGYKKVDAVTLDIIFMSKTCKLKVLWGTKAPIKLRDTDTNIPVTLRGHGEFEVQICNPRKFYLEVVGSDKNFNIQNIRDRLQVRMLSYIEPVISDFMKDEKLSYVDIASSKRKMSDAVLPTISKLFENDYGLKVYSFTIAEISIADEEIEAIENELESRRLEEKDKKNAKEIVDELERLKDKELEREVYLKKLEQEDTDKYYEVLKMLGWPNGKPNGGNGGQFCPNCGSPYNATMKFCPGCGKALPGGKKICSKCGNENSSESMFCSNCGNKL